MNKCYQCGGKLKRENIDIARYWGKDLIALNDVPSLVCTKCGERYFEAKVSSKIDERIQGVLERRSFIEKIDVPVVQF
ncbi:TPA: hypothetical protein DD690_00065 [Candidatus Daviesbacteria bacterium]|uniref:YgiT-type zinc finger domain protein n=1 Tax=Candidatus Daviesbacteria bacterium GW2011_GWF2_38_6 TaxID=1618432 RepID=A0A0G0KGW2_9BACT